MDESFLNDLLECSVCLEQLDSSSKVLPCQHTFCKRCLEEIVNSHKELRCPECRVLVETKVDELPSNILLIRLLEGIKNNPKLKTHQANALGKREGPPVLQSPVSLTPPHVSSSRQGMPTSVERRMVPKQVLQSSPCAKAIYPHEGKEPGDLSFKKGDTIILRKRIDQNWYHGEVNGKCGFLPAKFVQVMVPLPTHIPQCKALFDFSIGDNDEKDCLNFKKGEVITVIRRVDDNWAEGKLADRIGIFPISFVEMNVAARSLMKLSVNTQPGPSRVAPPTPTTDSLQVATPSVTKCSIGTCSTISHTHDSLSSTTTTPSPASSNTSPSTPSSSSSSSPSTPLPLTSLFPPLTESIVFPPSLRRSASQRCSYHQEKRHSLSSLSSGQKLPQTPGSFRHSLEIISTSGGDLLVTPKRTSAENKLSSVSCSIEASVSSTFASPINHERENSNARIFRRQSINRENEICGPSIAATTVVTSGINSGVSVTYSQSHAPVPLYVAQYSYKPQKDDELELKKGEIYTVSEKCQDGWFKGTSLRTNRSGVFPGNYVHLAKSSRVLSQVPLSLGDARNSPPPPRPKPPSVSPFQQSNLSSAPDTNVAQSRTSPSVYARSKSNYTEVRSSFANGLLEWARSVAIIASTPQRPVKPNVSQLPSSISSNKAQVVNEENATFTRSPNHIPWVNKSTQSNPALLSSPSNIPITVTTSMAASYPSPFTNFHSQQNSTTFPTSSSTGSFSQSWHSGRGNSRSTQSPLSSKLVTSSAGTSPTVSSKGKSVTGHLHHSSSKKNKERRDKCRESIMKRLSSKRKSHSPSANYSCDNPSFVDSTSLSSQSSASIIQSRSGSCPGDVSGCNNVNVADASVTEMPSSASRSKLSTTFVRERYRCVVPYPPNSEYELELKVGDVVYVHKKREDGWYKGTLVRTGKTGLFPASFVDMF